MLCRGPNAAREPACFHRSCPDAHRKLLADYGADSQPRRVTIAFRRTRCRRFAVPRKWVGRWMQLGIRRLRKWIGLEFLGRCFTRVGAGSGCCDWEQISLAGMGFSDGLVYFLGTWAVSGIGICCVLLSILLCSISFVCLLVCWLFVYVIVVSVIVVYHS